MKKEFIILAVLAAAAWFYFRRKDATENAGGPTVEVEPDGGAVSADAVLDYNGENISREQQIEIMTAAVGEAGRSQMAASTGGYAAVVSAFDNVDTDDLTYEQRSQMAASQTGSATVRAQAVGAAMAPIKKPVVSAPVAKPTTKQSLATTANMKGLAPVSPAGASAKQKAMLIAQQVQKNVAKAATVAKITAANNRVAAEVARVAAIKKNPKLPTAAQSTAAEIRSAATVAGAMTSQFNSDTGLTEVVSTNTLQAPRSFGFGAES